jgi:hypothetical protein
VGSAWESGRHRHDAILHQCSCLEIDVSAGHYFFCLFTVQGEMVFPGAAQKMSFQKPCMSLQQAAAVHLVFSSGCSDPDAYPTDQLRSVVIRLNLRHSGQHRTADALLRRGYRLPATGYRVPTTGYRLPAAGVTSSVRETPSRSRITRSVFPIRSSVSSACRSSTLVTGVSPNWRMMSLGRIPA